MVYPAYGVVFAKGITGFSLPSPADRRFQGDRNALWYAWFLASATINSHVT